MSRGHFSRASAITHLLAEVRRMTVAERYSLYGITIDPNGIVIDETSGKEYPTVQQWACAIVDEDAADENEYLEEYDRYDEEDY